MTGVKPKVCETCKGVGSVMTRPYTHMQVIVCPDCNGTGE